MSDKIKVMMTTDGKCPFHQELVLEANSEVSSDEKYYPQRRIDISVQRRTQRLLLEKGIALLQYGYYKHAIHKFREAINIEVNSLAIPFILTKIADAYNKLGEYEKSLNELIKAEYIIEVLHQHNVN